MKLILYRQGKDGIKEKEYSSWKEKYIQKGLNLAGRTGFFILKFKNGKKFGTITTKCN